MNLEIAGVIALFIAVAAVIFAEPQNQQECAPVEMIRYVRSEPEIRIKEVEKIIDKPAACQPVEDKAEKTVDEPVRRHRRHHRKRWR